MIEYNEVTDVVLDLLDIFNRYNYDKIIATGEGNLQYFRVILTYKKIKIFSINLDNDTKTNSIVSYNNTVYLIKSKKDVKDSIRNIKKDIFLYAVSNKNHEYYRIAKMLDIIIKEINEIGE